MDVLPSMRPPRARLCLDGSIEAEVAVPGVELPVKFSIERSAHRMFRGSVDGQEIGLVATDPPRYWSARRSMGRSPGCVGGARTDRD